MNIVDVLVIGLILLGAWQGYRKGFVTGVAQFAGSIIGFLVAALEYTKVLNWLKQVSPIQSLVESLVYQLIGPAIRSQASSMTQQDTNSILKMLPPGLRDSIIRSIPGLQSATSITQGLLEQLIHGISAFLTGKILPLLSFALIFMVISFSIQVLASIVLAPNNILGRSINRGGGELFGGLSAFLGLVVTAGMVSPLLNMDTQNSILLLLQHSFFLPYLILTFQTLSQLISQKLGADIFSLLKGF